jgi:hypothetical protein
MIETVIECVGCRDAELLGRRICSDAADLVFISGYTGAFVFGRVMTERGYAAAASRLAKRAITLYAGSSWS